MDYWSIATRRYTDPNRLATIQCPGVIRPESVLTEAEAMATPTRGLHERLGDFWVYLYVLEGEAYVMVQYHEGNRGLMVPPVALKNFERVACEVAAGGARALKLFFGAGQAWHFPYHVVQQRDEGQQCAGSPGIQDAEACDFGYFIAALARDRARLLDFIDFQDPEGEVIMRLTGTPRA